MKHLFCYLIVGVLLAACSGKKVKVASPAGVGQAKEDDYSALYSLQSADSAMATAIGQARSSLDSFTTALQSNNPKLANFALKIRFPGLGSAEDIWATNIKATPAGFTGVINNTPRLTAKVKAGDPVKFGKQNICDWMYTENGKLCGGFTIRLIRDRMTVKERAKFDTAFVFKVE